MSKNALPAGKIERDQWLAIEMRHLAALATVAQRSSFSGAAESLGYVQSAVSQQIGSLERIVGQRLVDRSARPRSVTATPAGRALLDHIDEILDQLELAKEDIDILHEQRVGACLGIDASLGSWLTAAVLGALLPADGSPGWERVEEGTPRELLDHVADGSLDAAFLPFPITSGPFFALELVRQRYVLAAPADFDGSSVEEILDRLPLVRIAQCRGTEAVLERHRGARARGAGPYRANGPASALALVRSGVAAAVLTWDGLGDSDASVAEVSLPWLPERVIGMAWHRDRDECPTVAALRTAARLAFPKT